MSPEPQQRFSDLKGRAQEQIAEAIGILHKTENLLIQIGRVFLDPTLHLRIEEVIKGDLQGEKASIQKEIKKLREIKSSIASLEHIEE